MPAIIIVLSFLVLFLLAFLSVLVAPFLGVGLAAWKHGKSDASLESSANSGANRA
ncbi:MAG: hypothetical protein WA192_06845 [Candidatus Acidiferrales bacterium]